MRRLAFLLLSIGRQPLLAHLNSTPQRSAATMPSGGEATSAPITTSEPRYYDARTWPKHWTATDVERLLCGNLLHPTAKPSYESLALLLHIGDHKSLALLLRAHVKPPPPTEVHLEHYLGESLNNTSDSALMPLQERTEQMNTLDAALSPQPGSVVPRVVFGSSPRGSGKTQFIKWFVSQKRAEAMKYGRVIVRCCDKTSHQTRSLSSWMNLLLESRLSEKPASRQPRPPTDVLCQLICAHVESVTGSPQNSSNYSDPKTAYATWMSETARCFGIPPSAGTTVDPLIILDTCELLAEHEHNALVKPSGKPYTLLEAFCLAVPAPYAIFVVGCNAQIDTTDSKYLSMANVTDIGPLVPLSERGYDDAIAESWKYEADAALRAPLHHLAGGVPRLLRLAFMKQPQNMSLASGSITALPRCFEVYSAAARAQYPIQTAWFPQAYTCLLASSTKAKVKGSDIIPVNPAWKKTKVSSGHGSVYALTYNEAAVMSMGTYNPETNRFMVPPITLGDTEAAMRPGAPILPSQLHPFLSADVIARYAAAHPVVVEHGPLFKKAFLYAVYARYLLTFWDDVRSPWVPLEKVFEGSIQPDQVTASKGYEVNVSSGVKMSANGRAETNAATLCEDDAQGDAFLWCRQKAKRSEPFAAVLFQGLLKRRPQLEHRNDLLVLTVVSQKNLPSTFPVEHAGNDIMINADAMSSLMIWPLTKKKKLTTE